MSRTSLAMFIAAAGILAVGSSASTANAQAAERSFRTLLRGFEEPPAVSSTGEGEFRAHVNAARTAFTYALSYSGLEGEVTQAHIHLGQKGVNGGIMVWLCQTAAAPGPEGTPTCPGPNEGTVQGRVTGASIVGPTGQGVDPGEFAELLNALGSEVAYVNVHSTRNLGGEIRGQID